ncbi:alcohol dehydrogenase GroES domain protein [Ameyamaea chiangmaiensis NBRC 103196]|uniref:NAD(P)-dependent alcohol dehydrogenase n=1 Tax=Ameyamaea chiangmaiensis TaxID=442969 RepID=A0A850P8D8_9PROT|nr:NAD(P)-dependent alcohol dehydrogenase [Ameyamaea chiangmaiensis]MBS4075519.1 NAD(P)-dependent alcohol dehydrogenase [Ameyamaea chiangmaiensis]NVN38949.1 NAD(P)-dependent alcohol dehydrogenase [Ameyamaea chiangmaiensis]GBQ69455.1 alcohol dehydrogenase GroES domain protein [Ameyamaea chiangmaiensis NBRC 103196]
MAEALVLEAKGKLALRDIPVDLAVGPDDVRVRIHTVGICGSDVHYYTHGRIGPFVVREPMILGHEAAGVVEAVGEHVTTLKVGDRVCMEPGIPDPNSRASRLGLYNVDPAVRFWATPPVHGCLTPLVVHPAAFTFRLPDQVSFAEGAMVEPFAVGVQAAVKGRVSIGDVCVVTGCGPIGLMTALAALANGASKVIVSDVAAPKLEIAARYANIVPVNLTETTLAETVRRECGADWGADVVFEASGNARAYDDALGAVRPGGTLVLVGMPIDKVPFDIVAAQAKEITIETVFRYANVYDRAIAAIASGRADLKPLVSVTYDLKDGIEAFDRAVEARPSDVKIQIRL